MSLLALQCALCMAFCLDFGIFVFSHINPDELSKRLLHLESPDPKFVRLFGSFALLFGLCRLHGALHIREKGAYRMALWSLIVELVHIGLEIHHGALDVQRHALAPVFVICGLFVLWMVLAYKTALYPAEKRH